MTLSAFNIETLFNATTDLFAQPGIPINSNITLAMSAQDILKEHYKDRAPFSSIREVYFAGLIDDSIFHPTLFTVHTYEEGMYQANLNYNGLMFFALEISKHPTRTEIAKLTRTFNYESLFKQGKAEEFKRLTDTISFINGGLFTCHDQKIKHNQSGNYIIDGFSDNPNDRAANSATVIFALIERR